MEEFDGETYIYSCHSCGWSEEVNTEKLRKQ